MSVIKICDVSKRIHGKVILESVSLELESGKIYGIVGRNGSGKTMLFRAISGLMRTDSGSISYDNSELHKDMAVLPSVGIILENAGLYPELTGFENLNYLARLKKIASKDDIRQAIIRVGLDPDDKRSYRKYSLGMKQRIAIAQAIMEKPDVLLLDEPTNALDEEGVGLIHNLILEEKERGVIILIASHVKEDIDVLADEVFHMRDGRIVE